MISPSDPSSAWTAKANKRVQFGYGLNYLIDIENAVIVDVEATPARTYDEVAATKTMIDRTERCFALRPKRLAADTAYGTGSSSAGSSTTKGSRRTSRSGRRVIERTASSRALTSSGTSGMATTSVPTGSLLPRSGTCTTARAALPRLETRLRCLFSEVEVLHQGRGAQDPSRSPRGCPRGGSPEDRRPRDSRQVA